VRAKRVWVSSLLLAVAVTVALVIPTAISAQYTPTTSISQLNFPNQIMSGTPVTVTFVVSYSMAGYSDLGAYIWDRDSQTSPAGNASASPHNCIPNESPGCFAYLLPYSVGIDSFVFRLNLSVGSYHFEVRASITDANLKPISSTTSKQDFSIAVVSQSIVAQSQSSVTQLTQSQPYQVLSQQASQSSTEVNSSGMVNFVGLLWVALALSAIGVATGFVLLYRLRRLERVEEESIGATLTQNPIQRLTQTKTTMFCRHCGVRIPRDSKFCQECGAKLT